MWIRRQWGLTVVAVALAVSVTGCGDDTEDLTRTSGEIPSVEVSVSQEPLPQRDPTGAVPSPTGEWTAPSSTPSQFAQIDPRETGAEAATLLSAVTSALTDRDDARVCQFIAAPLVGLKGMNQTQAVRFEDMVKCQNAVAALVADGTLSRDAVKATDITYTDPSTVVMVVTYSNKSALEMTVRKSSGVWLVGSASPADVPKQPKEPKGEPSTGEAVLVPPDPSQGNV